MSNQVPLSKLFKRIGNPYASVDDALKAIGADFEVEKRDVFILGNEINPDGEPDAVDVPGYAAVCKKDGTPLSIMRSRYGIVQYRDSVDFLTTMIGNRQVEVWAGSTVDNGAKMHLIVKAPDFIELAPGEKFECFYTVSASHDGTGCLQGMCSPIHNISQTVYTPTDGGIVKIKHTAKVEARLAQAKRMFDKLHSHFIGFGENIKDMVGIKLTDQEARDYIMSVIEGDNKRAENIRGKVFDIYKSVGLCVKLPSCNGTLFGAFMAFQQYADYYKTVRKSIRRNELDAKIEARLSGDGAKLKAESFAMALALVRQFS